MIRFAFLFYLVTFITTLNAQPSQKIIINVVDDASSTSIGFVSVKLTSTNFSKSSITDSSGTYIFNNIPVGRYNIEATSSGYTPTFISDIVVSSAKETVVTINLKQQTSQLSEVIVKTHLKKEQPLNSTASVSAKMLSVEEASRYAGGFDDPARLVSAFAGVSSNVGNNGISVRGNNPKSLQWKFEGIEISNPNHFADGNVFGGGVLSALSSHNLGNSDFFSGAFPAEYSNALSGVFDMNLRKGNSGKKERTIQIGLTGLDYAEEGPFKKGGKATYIFNYRYSTLALVKSLLPENGGKGVKYEDLSFKLNFPTKKAGTFSLWGLGLKDYTGIEAKKDTLEWETVTDRQSQDIRLYMAAVGLTHKYFINKKTYIKSIWATTKNGVDYDFKQLQRNGSLIPESNVKNDITNIILSSLINTKFDSKHSNKTGITITGMSFKLKLNQNAQSIVDETGGCLLLNAYTNSTYNFSDNLTMNLGVNAQLFTLNN
ncbi:MAG: carboxypeptidase regulatory-like domain-containing protein, partial [Bacteroidetes bacterium]|nr:carboxypeptidase regulatory-like domain-containing protein [Bacteroidota bacterium]